MKKIIAALLIGFVELALVHAEPALPSYLKESEDGYVVSLTNGQSSQKDVYDPAGHSTSKKVSILLNGTIWMSKEPQ